jgi:hypothetical protein
MRHVQTVKCWPEVVLLGMPFETATNSAKNTTNLENRLLQERWLAANIDGAFIAATLRNAL